MKEQNLGIVGNGCMARHLKHYLDMENIPYRSWSRTDNTCSPHTILKNCQHVILLISDDSIEQFIAENPQLHTMNLVHFSGSLLTDKAVGMHPLMTFSNELYTLKEYREIPFIGEKGRIKLQDVIPDLKNNYYEIPASAKSLYHALCVISGNFTNILWSKTMNDFEKKLKLPKELLLPYLNRAVLNIKKSPFNSLTGPIKREDKKTIKRNMNALDKSIWKKIYSLFNKVYKKEIK